jgi:hypothetical protein
VERPAVDPKTLIFFVFLFASVGLVVLSLPLVLGKVPPNPWYGFRVRRTLTDAAVWYAANRYSGWWMLAAGIAWMIAATAGYLSPVGLVPYALGCAGVLLAALVVGFVQTLRYLRRLEKTGGGTPP